MARTITIAVPLPAGPDHAAAFRADPAAWLPAGRPQGGRTWRFELTALGWQRPVLAEISNPIVTRSGVCRRLSWEAVTVDGDIVPGHRWLPGFHGELCILGDSHAQSVVLAGEVDPPLGGLGAAIDAVVLGRVADGSLDALLRTVAERLRAIPPAGDTQPGPVTTSGRAT